MDAYNTLAGALVIGAMLLFGSGVIFVGTRIEEALHSAPNRATARRVLKPALGIVLFLVIFIGLTRFSFDRAFNSTQVLVPRHEVRWEPVGELPTTSFDRFDFGSASNAEIAHRS